MVNWTAGNKIQLNVSQNTNIFVLENEFETSKIVAIDYTDTKFDTIPKNDCNCQKSLIYAILCTQVQPCIVLFWIDFQLYTIGWIFFSINVTFHNYALL